MKTRITRLMTLALCLLLCAFAWPSTAYAFDPVDLEHPVSLTIFANDEEVPLAGVGFELYRVAQMNQYAQFEILPAYAAYVGDLNMLKTTAEWIECAEAMKAIAADLSPNDAATSNGEGLAVFSSLEPGLYLVTGQPVEILPWAYSFNSFMLSIPTRDMDDEWIYDVYSDVKLEKDFALTDIDVVKLWDDLDFEDRRPEYIHVDLYSDGELIDSVRLDDSNGWRHTFTELPATHEYTVQEREVPGKYTVTYEVINGALVIRNTYKVTVTPVPDLPQTGQLWWPVPVLAGAGMLLFIIGWFIHQKWSQEHE